MTRFPCISPGCLALVLVLGSQLTPAAADETYMLSGVFDGGERVSPLLSADGACHSDPDPWAAKAVQEISLRVSRSGVYSVRDLGWFSWDYHGILVTPYLFAGAYVPGRAPIAASGESGIEYRLTADTDYTLLLQQRCDGEEGAWAVAVHGPGTLESEAAVGLPALSSGTLSAADPRMTADCGSLWGAWSWGETRNAPYRQVGPVRVSRSGTYFHTALASEPFDEIQTCLSVYTAPVDPGNRFANRLALLGTWYNTVHLEAGKDYWFVTHWGGHYGWPQYGRYMQMLSPPAQPRLNPGMAGAWYDPEQPGEGWFITVFDSINQVFLAHFGFGAAEPGTNPPQLWSTAQGRFRGNRAELTITRSEGGAFNAPTPEAYQTMEGTLDLEFENCKQGRIRFTPAAGNSMASGEPSEYPIVRVADDSVRLCETLYAGPGKLGPL